MGAIDVAKEALDRVMTLFERLAKLDAKVDGVQSAFDRLRDDQRYYTDHVREEVRRQQQELREAVREMQRDFDELRRRLTVVEGLTETALQLALKDAIVELGREHIRKHGTLEDFNPVQTLVEAEETPATPGERDETRGQAITEESDEEEFRNR